MNPDDSDFCRPAAARRTPIWNFRPPGTEGPPFKDKRNPEKKRPPFRIVY